MSSRYLESRHKYDEMKKQAKSHACECGRDLVLARYQGEDVLRCGRCGYSPKTKRRKVMSLLAIYKKYGIDGLGAIERMTLSKQLWNKVAWQEAEDIYNSPERYILNQLEREMSTGHALITIGDTRAVMSALSIQSIREMFCPTATDAEISVFAQWCVMEDLSPFNKDCFLVKYGGPTSPASMLVAKGLRLKRAEDHPAYDGHQAGIIFQADGGNIEYRASALLLPGENLIGGWAEIKRRDRSFPTRVEGLFEEVVQLKDGQPMAQWAKQPAWMCRNAFLRRCLVEAFPNLRSYVEPGDIGISDADLPEPPVDISGLLSANTVEQPVISVRSDGSVEGIYTEVLQETTMPDGVIEMGAPVTNIESEIADFLASIDGAASADELEDTKKYLAGVVLTDAQTKKLDAAYTAKEKKLRAKATNPAML